MRGGGDADAAPVVTPELIDAAIVAAAATDERAMRANPRGSRDGGLRPFIRPAAGGLTGWFGEPRGGRAHLGIDIDGATGDPVVAAGPGTVAHAGPAPAGYGGYGLLVAIDHGDGVVTVYAHLSLVHVVAGQPVETRDLVGAIGTTGITTGSHLHFEVRVDGVLVDPGPWLGT
jgi:murein DD-endopeptidase MepM/ murein hydrolase activator NlpD